jgi:hypothetical protein
MSYEFWLLVGQNRQIQIAQQQVRQLGAIHDQLARQNFIQQQQAALAHALFELETFTRRVASIAQADTFAAGVLGRVRLNNMQGLTPELFMQLEHKRSWAYATETLEALWRGAQGNPMAHRIAAVVQTLIDWNQRLGPDPNSRMAQLNKSCEAAHNKVKNAAILMVLGIVVGGLLIFGGIALLAGGKTKQESDSWWVLVLPGIAAVVLGIMGVVDAKKKLGEANAAARDYHALYGQFNAWLASPEGGGLLNEAHRRHPLLNS